MKKIFFLLVICMIASTARPQGGLTAVSYSSNQIWTTPDGIDFIYDTAYFGGTLYSFAQKHLGDGERWHELLPLNQSLTDPGRTQVNNRGKKFTMLFVGEVIKVPFARSYPCTNPIPPVKIADQSDPKWLVWFQNNWGWVLFGAWLISTIIYLLFDSWSKRRDPITSGKPEVPGGVNDAGAEARLRFIAQKRFKQDWKMVKVDFGYLSGLANVVYENKPSGLLRQLKDIEAYQGLIEFTDGTRKTIYFLQGCGNDAKSGTYFDGTELTFVPERKIPLAPVDSSPIMDQAPIVEKAPAAEANAEVKDSKFVNETSHESKTESVTGSESHRETMKLLDLAKDLLSDDQEKWKVEVSIKNDETKLIVEFKKESNKKENSH